jgi:hypothetical protein
MGVGVASGAATALQLPIPFNPVFLSLMALVAGEILEVIILRMPAVPIAVIETDPGLRRRIRHARNL